MLLLLVSNKTHGKMFPTADLFLKEGLYNARLAWVLFNQTLEQRLQADYIAELRDAVRDGRNRRSSISQKINKSFLGRPSNFAHYF